MLTQDTIRGLTAVINSEDEAFQIIHALRDKFSMVGAEFCRNDIETMWDQRHADGEVDTDFSDDHWDICVGLRSWYRLVQEQMIEAGHNTIMDSVMEDIDKEFDRE